MTEPINIILGQNFLQTGQSLLNFIIMIEVGKKYKKIAKGELKLLTKYFLDNKILYENWISIKPFQKQLENFGVQSDLLKDEINSGKIYATIELKDSPEDFQKKTIVFQQNTKNDNTNLLKNVIQFDDNLSDVSISIVETKEEDRDGLELDQFIEYEYIEGLKLLLQNDYKNILPNDFIKLKQMNEILYGKFNDLSNAYNETLYSLSSINEEIRQQAKKYYEEYKLLKKDVYNGRIDLKKNNDILKAEIQNNNQDNNTIKQEIKDFITNKNEFKKQLGMETDNKNNTSKQNNNLSSLEALTSTLKNLHNMGYDIFKNSNLSEEEKKIVEDTLKLNLNQNSSSKKSKEIPIESSEKKSQNEQKLSEEKSSNKKNLEEENMQNEGEDYEGYDNEEDMKNDSELGNQIVSLIEKDVNDLYLRKVIEQIKIDQINAITYSFEDDNEQAHEVTLKIINNELYCDDGTQFKTWLLNNFLLK